MNAMKPPSEEMIRMQLERILASTDFDTAQRTRDFLRHVVEATLAGHGEEMSQNAIAMEVFQRGSDFDPTTDPIVRIQAGRVRRSLERYYLTTGTQDSVVISLPKGAYNPVFQLRNDMPEETPVPKSKEPGRQEGSWPMLLLVPFRNLTGDAALDCVAQGLASDLAVELSRYPELEVILSTHEDDPRNQRVDADFEIHGCVGLEEAELKVSAQLVASRRRQIIWGQTYSPFQPGPALGPFLDGLARTLAATIAGERGMVVQHGESNLGRHHAIEHRAYDAILRYHRFESSPSPASYQHALDSLETALRNDPNCASCCGYLARLLAYSYANGNSPEAELIERAVELATRAVRLAPGNQRALATLSYVHLLNDQVGDARLEAQEALELNPKSLLIMDGLGYLLTLTGDWEQGPALSRKAIRLNPFHLPIVHAGLWLDALRREDYEESWQQAMSFRTPQHFWDPLMKAVASAFLGQSDEARAKVRQLLELKPDFPERARWLISRYVKFDPQIKRIRKGLAMAGIPDGD